MSSLNSSAPDCEQIQDLIPDYAFGLTDPEQTRLVESNLATCPEAAAQLAEFRLLQDDMRDSVPQMEPPPLLGERLMAAVAAPSIEVKSRRRIQWSWMAAAAVAALIITNVYWFARVNTLNAAATEQIQPSNSNAFVLTSTSNLRWARLPASQEAAEASAFLMWNGESEIGLLYARGFDTMAPGATYRLWLTRGEDKVSAGTFNVDDKGIGTLLFHITEPIDKFTWARITDEMTGEVVANGELPVN